jgi:hypothetical protein
MKQVALKVVEPPEPVPMIDWEAAEASVPECPIYTDSELGEEWYQRQRALDNARRPVDPPKAPSRKALQIEMFESSHETLFKSDMKFEKFELKPDPKAGAMIGKITLSVDSADGRVSSCRFSSSRTSSWTS